MPDWLELMTLNLPGRQARFGEPMCTNIEALAEELALYWASHPQPLLLFFGYCSGALIAYCVARRLQERKATLPRGLVVSSYKAPHLVTSGPLDELDIDEFWAVLIANNAVSPMFAEHAELREISEPAIRGDMALVAGYRHVPREPLAIPITVLVGEQDAWITAPDVAAWEQYTAQGFAIKNLPTGHWLMEGNAVAAREALIAEAAAVRG
jgi:surfactin synthase thioesterase subunit